MVIKKVKYNPVCDLAAVEPFGFIDLAVAVEKSEIPSGIANTELEYDGCEDPSKIIGKPRDVFEAYRMADLVKETRNSRIAKEKSGDE